jgi:uncharacterized protein YkwD
MGLAGRDYMRHQPRRRRPWLANVAGVVLLLGLLLAILALLRSRDEPSATIVSPGVFGVRLSGPSQPVYPRDDPWKGHLAPENICPEGENRSRPAGEQEQTMICLLNWARQRAGLEALSQQPLLFQAAALKARDIAACDDFAHEACGKPASAVVTEAGYSPSAWGENIFLGPAAFGSPRVAVDHWLNSTGHRKNLFRTEWSEQGVALLELHSFGGQRDVAVWVSHFAR